MRLLGVFAHPDDETFCAGGTLARHTDGGGEAMVVSFTRGEAGQIRDAQRATRRTLAEVREQELHQACQELGVQHVQCLDYRDGTLADVDPAELAERVGLLLAEFRPDAVVTFGPDGAYGHPDHSAIGSATTAACRAYGASRLFHSHFPRSRLLLLRQLARWLVDMKTPFHGSMDFLRALSIFAQETTTLGYAGDFVDVAWFPAGSYLIEQGERATALYLILSGAAEVVREDEDGSRHSLAELQPGDFVGELGVAWGRPRAADVVAVENVTCLALSFEEPSAYSGRGSDARLVGRLATEPDAELEGATTCIDVRDYVDRKVAAIAAHRSQYPITPDMFPPSMLEEMFASEYFVRVLPPRQRDSDLF